MAPLLQLLSGACVDLHPFSNGLRGGGLTWTGFVSVVSTGASDQLRGCW